MHKWLLVGDGLTDPSDELIVHRPLHSEQRELPYVKWEVLSNLKEKRYKPDNNIQNIKEIPRFL